jgi:hypothetical protein
VGLPTHSGPFLSGPDAPARWGRGVLLRDCLGPPHLLALARKGYVDGRIVRGKGGGSQENEDNIFWQHIQRLISIHLVLRTSHIARNSHYVNCTCQGKNQIFREK